MGATPTIEDSMEPKGRRMRLALGFGALIMLTLLFALIVRNALDATKARREAEAWYVHTLQVLVTTEALKSAVNAAIRGERGYLITRDPQFLGPYYSGLQDAPTLARKLAEQTGDNPNQRRHLSVLNRQLDSYFDTLGTTVALQRNGRSNEAVAKVRTGLGKQQVEALLATIGSIEDEEDRLLAERSAVNERANAAIERHYYGLVGVGILFIGIAAVAGLSTARYQQRARAMARKLHRAATTDELTGLANRRSFMDALEIEVVRAQRSGQPLTVAIADLDHFKQINDTYGHGGGDEVLRTLARVAQETVRAGDLIGRIGGEEFAILMPNTDVAEARTACERLRRAIAARPIKLAGSADVHVTLSSGIALLVPGEDQNRFVTRADDALYRAKEAGRNQVRLAAA